MVKPNSLNLKSLSRLALFCLLAGVLVAGVIFPFAAGFGALTNKASATVENVGSQLLDGDIPEVATMTDINGKPIAYLYDQRRVQVGYNAISPEMIKAIVSIEDRRFFDHDGWDWRGTLRAFVKNSSSGEVQQGASTLDQQYIKNFQLLVLARSDADRQAAIETTPARKLREIRMAINLEQSLIQQAQTELNLSESAAKQEAKKQIVTRYLNLVPFGNGAYGIEVAARTYFNKNAKDLNAQESAMLAGMVQSSSQFDPYIYPKAVTERRNLVLDAMESSFPSDANKYEAAKSAPLGVLTQPKGQQQGCISAGSNGFFCDYALKFLAENGMSRENITRGGYTIQTTLDPLVQSSTLKAIRAQADPMADGIANVMNVIRPGQQSHDVLAMASSREYGLDRNRRQTVQPQPFSMVGDGAGSIFKIFTVAAAMEKGLGISARLSVPSEIAVEGMGASSDFPGCPANSYCVKNAGRYPASMTITQALAQSPNTAFVQLLQQVSVKSTVDIAVRLGLRSYAQPGTSSNDNQSLADYVTQGNFGSFTLGPTAVNTLELSNVAATLASSGKWCPPNPIQSITQPKRDRAGNPIIGADGKPATQPIPLATAPCEQVVESGLARTLATALSEDDKGGGTSAGAAGSVGWNLPVSGKTGTTEAHRSSAFLGFTNTLAGASYVYNDSTAPQGICTSPLRHCGEGDLYGGMEPARTWYSAIFPVVGKFGPTLLPPTDPRYVTGSEQSQVPNVTGQTASAARATLEQRGFKVTESWVTNTMSAGTVVSVSPSDSALPGSTLTILISDGRGVVTPSRRPGRTPRKTTINIPGLGPVEIPIG